MANTIDVSGFCLFSLHIATATIITTISIATTIITATIITRVSAHTFWQNRPRNN
jgi:hypothetical protein